jgi:hypothetical protein
MSSGSLTKTELIESKIDRGIANNVAISRQSGGVAFNSMGEVMEFAKMLAVSGQAVPAHCRLQAGICLGIVVQAIEWRMSPYAVANKSYVVNDRLAYESQLIHAVIEQRAPIVSRLRHEFSGSGDTRRCRVWATPRGEAEPLVYESPEFKTITPKNSPLWKSKPDLQLYYNTSRDWARAYFPDVILGVYAEDELEAATIDSFRKAPPTSIEDLTERLKPQVIIEQPPAAAETAVVENGTLFPEAISGEPSLTFDTLRVELAGAKTPKAVAKVCEKYVAAMSEQDEPIVMEICTAREEELKANA